MSKIEERSKSDKPDDQVKLQQNRTGCKPNRRASLIFREQQAIIKGPLLKLGSFRKNWKARYFHLFPSQIQYRRRREDPLPAGLIQLEGSCACLVRKSHEYKNGAKELHIRSASQQRTFRIRGTEEELENWIKKINTCIQMLQHTVSRDQHAPHLLLHTNDLNDGDSVEVGFEEACL
eukprot:gene7916-10009_t